MSRECFFKGHSSLRKVIAGGLSATFCSGMCCSNYAGAMLEYDDNFLINNEKAMKEEQYESLCTEFKSYVEENREKFLNKVPDSEAIAFMLFSYEQLTAAQYLLSVKSPAGEDVKKRILSALGGRKIAEEDFLNMYVEYFLKTKAIGEDGHLRKLEDLKGMFGKCFRYRYIRCFEGFSEELSEGTYSFGSKKDTEEVSKRAKTDDSIENFIYKLVSSKEEVVNKISGEEYGKKISDFCGDIGFLRKELTRSMPYLPRDHFLFEFSVSTRKYMLTFFIVAFGFSLLLITYAFQLESLQEKLKEARQQLDAEKNGEKKGSETAKVSGAQNGVEGAATPSV